MRPRRTPTNPIRIGRTWLFADGTRLPVVAGGDGEDQPLVIPDDLSAIPDDELAALRDEIVAEIDAIVDAGDTSQLERATELADTLARGEGETSSRDRRRAAEAAALDELRRRVHPEATNDEGDPDEGDGGGDDPGAGDPAGGDGGQGAETPAPQATAELVASTRRPVSASNTARRAGRPRVETTTPRVTITASADVPGIGQGSTLTLDALGEAMHARARTLPDRSAKAPVARFTIPTDFRITKQTSDEQAEAIIAAATDTTRLFRPDGLVAAGGWCAPSQTLFDFVAYQGATGLLDLPTVGIERAGINVPSYIGLDAADSALWTWSEDQDNVPQLTLTSNIVAGGVGTANTSVNHLIAVGDLVELRGTGLTDGPRTVTGITDADTFTYDATGVPNATYGNGQAIRQKTCFEIPCPTWTEYRLGAYGLCLKNGNLMSQAMPELDRRFIQIATAAHAHRMSAVNLAKIRSSTHSTTVAVTSIAATDNYGDLMSAVELQLEDYRSQYKLADTVPFEVLMPTSVLPQLRADLAMRRPGDNGRAVTNAQLAAEFAVRRARPQFLEDYLPLWSGAPRVAWPTTTEFVVYPAGDFFVGTGGTLDLSVQRDSRQNATNDHTVLWTEDFSLLARRGPKARVCTLALGGPDGITGQ